jgi:transcriptional regulator with XRE-family HTH domain
MPKIRAAGASKLGPRIRKRRQGLSMTLQELSNASGVSIGYLSQVERDNAVPTLGTLAQIAAALHVGVDYFIATPHQADSLTRAAERSRFSVAGTSIIYEQLGSEFPGHELTSFILHVPPGYASETAQHEGEEIIFILEGTVLQMVDGQEFVLNEGDSLHYLGDRPHSWSNTTGKPARILWTGKMLHSATHSNASVRPGVTTARPKIVDSSTT